MLSCLYLQIPRSVVRLWYSHKALAPDPSNCLPHPCPFQCCSAVLEEVSPEDWCHWNILVFNSAGSSMRPRVFVSITNPSSSLLWPAETCSLQYLYFPLTQIFQLLLHWENSITWESSLLLFTKPTHLHIFALILSFMTTQEMSKSKIHLPAHAMHPLHSNILGPFLSLMLSDSFLFSFNGSSITTSLTVSTTLKLIKKEFKKGEKSSLYLPFSSPHSQIPQFIFSASLPSTHPLTHCNLCPTLLFIGSVNLSEMTYNETKFTIG